MHVLIVDHQLRKESKKESLKVKSILKRKKIQSKILKWKGKVPKSNIQKNARNIRYNLISEYCFKNGIKYLVTAHHLDDQIENFFIRLFRGSGLTGLSSMPESFIFNNLYVKSCFHLFLSIEKLTKHIILLRSNPFNAFL